MGQNIMVRPNSFFQNQFFSAFITCRKLWAMILACILSMGSPGAAIKGHLEPGLSKTDIAVSGNQSFMAAFIHSSFNNTAVKLGFHCDSAVADFSYKVQFVLRSSPCDKEFYDAIAFPQQLSRQWLQIYFGDPDIKLKSVQVPFTPDYYDQVYYYKSKVKSLKCNDPFFFNDQTARMLPYTVERPQKEERNPTKPTVAERDKVRKRRDANNEKKETEEESPAIRTPADAVYLLLVEITIETSVHERHNVTVEVGWKGKHGYLSAIDWPLLPFYGVMCAMYAVLAFIWLVVSCVQWKDLLRIQYWIGAVILLGMVEKATFYAEYQTLNATGSSVLGAIEFAEIVSCLKRTLARLLIIIVSVGFGVVKPRLGSTLHKVVGLGFAYFLLSAVEAINRVSQKHAENGKQKQMAGLPLTLMEIGIFWWIFSSLLNTMRALRLRRNEVKLDLYRHFTNTLIFAVLSSVAFMGWSLYMHTFTPCLKDWTELWVDTAFWHILFSVILIVIMILWRPTNNNQRYAFTPLLDGDEDDDSEEDTIFSGAYMTSEALKMRGMESTTRAAKRGQSRDAGDNTLEEELRWVEENIPTSLADKALPALIDSDEEVQQQRLEMSKIQ